MMTSHIQFQSNLDFKILNDYRELILKSLTAVINGIQTKKKKDIEFAKQSTKSQRLLLYRAEMSLQLIWFAGVLVM